MVYSWTQMWELCRDGALYRLKSSGAAWCAMFLAFIKTGLGFTPTRADPHVYYRKKINVNGDHYYKYLLVYVDIRSSQIVDMGHF